MLKYKALPWRKDGQAVVEFALIFPLVVFMLFAVIEFGRLMQAYVTIQHASREGARYAVTGRSITGSFDDRPQSIVQVTRQALAGLKVIPRADTPAREASSVAFDADVEIDPPDAVDPRNRPRPFTPEPITVRVYYNFAPILPIHIDLLGTRVTIIPDIIPLVGQTTMMVERIDRVTPVVEGTLISGEGGGGDGGGGGQPTATATPTPQSGGQGGGGGAATSTPTPTLIPTWTPTRIPTITPTFTPTPTPTVTLTPTPPLPTSSPTPTSTSVNGCVDITWLNNPNKKEDKLKLRLTNATSLDWTLVELVLIWPANGKGKVEEIKMSGSKVWEGSEKSSPLIVTQWRNNTTAARTVSYSNATNMEIKLGKIKTNAGQFSITLTFAYDTTMCTVSSSWP